MFYSRSFRSTISESERQRDGLNERCRGERHHSFDECPTGENYTATTNENGSFTIPLIKPGPYEMNVQAQGFKQYKRGGLVLETATPARVDVALEVGAVTDVVNVEATAPILQTENSSVRILACRIRDAAIQRLGASAA